ncbi:beta-ketoacyl synthase N-terminal-like domain-containing protein [soil metagenome]
MGDGAGAAGLLRERRSARELALELCRRVHRSPAKRTALVLATTKGDLAPLTESARDNAPSLAAGSRPGALAAMLALELRIDGPAFAVSNACASGLVAIVSAARLLERGAAERALVIGVDVLSPFIVDGFASLGALDSKPCRPYDSSRAGLSLGEGAGVMLLTRDSNGAVAAVRGYGLSNDANHITGPSRDGAELAAAIHGALSMSEWAPRDIHCINGHGTGTEYNDEMEAKALGLAFGDAQPPLTSLKGAIGHTLGAAGIVEAAIMLRALRDGVAPGTHGFSERGVSVPVNVSASARTIRDGRNLLAIKSGFGGVNAAVCFEVLR